MANEITLPRLGWDMTEGALDSWRKKDGEFVKEGEILFEMEGDKAVQEVEALGSGYLRILPNGPKQGEKVPVGTVIGYLVPEAELADFRLPGLSTPEPIQQVAATLASAANVLAETVEQPQVHSVGDGHIRRIYISPYAKKMADGLGLEWRKIQGTGAAGRIMAKDVELAASSQKSVAVKSPVLVETSQPAPAAAAGQRLEMSQIRKKIAEHMAYSAHTAAPVTLSTEVDATELASLRKALKEDAASAGQPQVPSYNDLLAKLCAQALQEHPNVNARIEGNEIVLLETVNIAVAVDTERGLIVPVLRDVQSKSLRQIARESAVLIEKTRSGAVSYAELQGATFTITNLGMFDIDTFTPIIDLPQCAILGVGRIVAKQVVVDAESERLAIRKRMVLSLTFDHRLIDGAQAAKFLQRVKKLVENPYLWLVG